MPGMQQNTVINGSVVLCSFNNHGFSVLSTEGVY